LISSNFDEQFSQPAFETLIVEKVFTSQSSSSNFLMASTRTSAEENPKLYN